MVKQLTNVSMFLFLIDSFDCFDRFVRFDSFYRLTPFGDAVRQNDHNGTISYHYDCFSRTTIMIVLYHLEAFRDLYIVEFHGIM